MITRVENTILHRRTSPALCYSPDVLPRLQSLLADLADLDLAFENNLEALRRAPDDESSKVELLGRLRQAHEERRAPLVGALTALQQEIAAEVS